MQVIQNVVQLEQVRGTGRCSLVMSQVDNFISHLIPRGAGVNGLAHFLLLDPVEGGSISFNENSDPAVRHDLATAAGTLF